MCEIDLTKTIPKDALMIGLWYVGSGRKSKVGMWNGENFMVFMDNGADAYVPFYEDYYGPEDGTFRPFAVVDFNYTKEKLIVSLKQL